MEQRSSVMMVSLKPEPIPLDLKVILIGNANIYHTLLSMDIDFRKLFKIKVEFEGYCLWVGTFGTESAVRKRGGSRNLPYLNAKPRQIPLLGTYA